MRKVWNVGIYARVSTDKKEQQESIPAQIQSLKSWLLEKAKSDTTAVYNLVEIYEDWGASGSNFERESFIRMKTDIENGRIDMVLTRDLSRFSRNYILAGYYLEDYFRVHGVRFVSVLDNVDTVQEVDDIVPFKNILNEMYIKDCSRRSRDGLKQRMLRGSHIASKPPYGYVCQEIYEGNVKTIKLVPAGDETTQVVKEIFNLYLQGWGVGKIATYLNRNGIKPPAARLSNFSKSKFGLWSNNGVKSILTNPKYGGIMVQGRWKKISYKVNKIRKTSKDEWIYGGEFEGIVSKEIFYKVQELMKKRGENYRYKNDSVHIFSGVLKCNECGGSMTYRKKFKGYKCTNSQMGGGRCTAHSVKEEYLKKIILDDLKKLVNKHNRDGMYYEEIKTIKIENDFEEKLKKIDEEISLTDRKLESIYTDKLNNIITERNFNMLINSIQKKQEELLKKKEELQAKINSANSKNQIIEKYKEFINKIVEFKNFDRFTIESLIDQIVVIEDKCSKEKTINIYYKFSIK